MKKFKDKSRSIARELYWKKHDRDSYKCPDCGRGEADVVGGFEVHHQNGEPMDNRPENHVGLCRLCHNLREGKKPSKKQIRHLRSQRKNHQEGKNTSGGGKGSVYLAGSMDYESSEHQSWRSSVAERGDRGTYKYTGDTSLQINSPTEVSFSHGGGIVDEIAGKDMRLIDASDAIIAYFEKKGQVGTLTELVYAVTSGKPALVLFDDSLVPGRTSPGLPEISDGVEYQFISPTYWFLINFLEGDGWDGLDADIEMRVVKSRGEIKPAFKDWSWRRKNNL